MLLLPQVITYQIKLILIIGQTPKLNIKTEKNVELVVRQLKGGKQIVPNVRNMRCLNNVLIVPKNSRLQPFLRMVQS